MEQTIFEKMAKSVIDGELEEAENLARQSIAQGIPPLEAINKGYVAGINYVGEQFGAGEMFLPELVMAAEAMKAAIAILEPELTRQGSQRDYLGKVVIGTVKGDIHDIGKTLVATMLSASGFQVYDLGCDVSKEDFVNKAKEVKADIIGLSSLLTTTMVYQRDVINSIKDHGLRQKIKVIVGGAPVTQSWADEIGADGYSEDAFGAVMLAKRLMGR